MVKVSPYVIRMRDLAPSLRLPDRAVQEREDQMAYPNQEDLLERVKAAGGWQLMHDVENALMDYYGRGEEEGDCRVSQRRRHDRRCSDGS